MLLLTVLTVTVLIMGQRLGITIDACLSAAVPYKNDHGKEHQQHGAENKAPHTLKHRQPREGAQTVPHHHKAEEAREQKTDRALLPANQQTEHPQSHPEENIKILQKRHKTISFA